MIRARKHRILRASLKKALEDPWSSVDEPSKREALDDDGDDDGDEIKKGKKKLTSRRACWSGRRARRHPWRRP